MSSNDNSAEIGRPLTEFVLVEDPSVLGVTRDKLGALLHSIKASGFTVTIRELNAVHGVWDETAADKQYASLLILRVQLHDQDPSRRRRFKNLRVGLKFSTVNEKPDPTEDPLIACFAPAQNHKIGLLPTSVLREKKKNGEISLDIDANPAPVTVAATLGIEKSWQWQHDVMATASGTARQEPYSKGREGDNFVEWAIGENEYERRNADSVDVAVLLRRPNDSPFWLNFSGVEASVDFSYSFKETVNEMKKGIKKLLGVEVPSDVVTYDPSKQGDSLTGVEPKNMKALQDGDELEKYAFIHILDKMRAVRY